MSTTTQFWVGQIIKDELEALATNFEKSGPEAPWNGQEIADHIRDRIKNHPAITGAPGYEHH